MSSRDLVGRPLVPFFDSDENVNESLQFAEGDNRREEVDVDARVWDKELGYFVYPSEDRNLGSRQVASEPTRRGSSTKLLTPSMMLSSSVPVHVNSIVADVTSVQSSPDISAVAPNRLLKASSKERSRSTTPARRRKGEEKREDASTTLKKGKSKTIKQQQQLSASGKWAWSAFQSSPDPSELPLPPFFTKSVGTSNGTTSPCLALSPPTSSPTGHINVPIIPPLLPSPPSSKLAQPPPPPRPSAPPEVPMSIETSMTRDLWKMLNIGGT